MSEQPTQRTFRWLAAALCGVAMAATPLVSSAADEPLDAVVEHLNRMEDLARRMGSARAEFSVTYLPTTPPAAAIIRGVNQLRSQSPEARILAADDARQASYRSVWMRKGSLEREDRTYSDGTTVTIGIRSAGRRFTDLYFIQPYSLVFEYRGQPLSEWLRLAQHREAARGTVNGRERTQLSFVGHNDDAPLFVLIFDNRQRLVAREVYLEGRNYLVENTRHTLRLHARHEFSDHQAYGDGGDKIWIPLKAMLRYYVGETADGKQLEECAIQVNIKEFELNAELPDDAFLRRSKPQELMRALSKNPRY